MTFGLKNVRVTFQRMVNKVFKELIRHTMEVYVNDILMKSLQCIDHVQHLSEAFDRLRKYKVRLNLENCTFDVASEKFLGYLVTQLGIEANLDQIFVILDMSPRLVSRKCWTDV